MLLPIREGEIDQSPAAYRVPLRQVLIEDNTGHLNIIVCEADYKTLKLRYRAFAAGRARLPPHALRCLWASQNGCSWHDHFGDVASKSVVNGLRGASRSSFSVIRSTGP